jgi:glycosyltransferase involved in cell wall biosynthesis
MRIAVVFENSLRSGGGFQQGLSTACILNKHQGKDCTFVFYTLFKTNLSILKQNGIEARYLGWLAWVYWALSRYLTTLKLCRVLGTFFRFPIESVFVKDRIELVYFLMPSPFAILLKKINYVITVWDLCHRDHPEFPEVRCKGQFEYRELIFSTALPKAVAVIVDSSLGKDNVARRYSCDPERIYVAQFLPAFDTVMESTVDVKSKYGIKRPYLFYPAQFWAHKNHAYILEGLSVLKTKCGVELDAVFSGADKGNLKYVLGYAVKLGLEENVHCVGFIPNNEVGIFYKNAIALVMPTYFGPTNIPPLEAFALRCPVCYPDLPGLRDQVEDAAFLLDLNNPESLATRIMEILNDNVLVQEKLSKGQAIVASWTEDDYWQVLSGIFDQYAVKLRCWS